MARAFQNLGKAVRGVLVVVVDQTADCVRQAARSAKKGTAFHADVAVTVGIAGQITEDSEGNIDLAISANIPLAGIGPLSAGEVTPSIGLGSSTTGSFVGPGNAQVTARVVIVNAQALDAGVSANDPGELGGGQ